MLASYEEAELSGVFSKLKKHVKVSLNPKKAIKRSVKHLAKIAPAAPVLAFIPVVGQALAVASKAAQALEAKRKAKAAAAVGSAEEAALQKEIEQLEAQKNAAIVKTNETVEQVKMTAPAVVAQAGGYSQPLMPSGTSGGATYSPQSQQDAAPSFFEQHKTQLLIGGGVLAAVGLIYAARSGK